MTDKPKKKPAAQTKNATKTDAIAQQFQEILEEVGATPGEACSAACAIIKNSMEMVPQVNRQNLFWQMVEDIRPQLH